MSQQNLRSFKYNSQDITDAVDRVNPEQEYYQAHDITGDLEIETFCNWFVADTLYVLGISIPRYSHTDGAGSYAVPHPLYGYHPPEKPRSANELFTFFKNGGYDNWKSVVASGVIEFVNNGHVLIGCAQGIKGASGHIALVIPNQDNLTIHIAQAGLICSKDIVVNDGFGTLTPKYYLYSSIRSNLVLDRR